MLSKQTDFPVNTNFMNPLIVNSTMLLLLQILLVEEKTNYPVNTSILPALQSAS